MEGYLQNAQGHLVPVNLVKDVDLARDELVKEIAGKAAEMSEKLAQLKGSLMGDIEAFVQLSAEKYGVAMGGKKGNVQLLSYDGSLKIVRSIAENITFDERLVAARELIGQCIDEWSEGSRDEIRTLVEAAFSTDSSGNLNTARILSLRRLDIKDERWQQAMQAISESVQVSGTKPYVRVYKRGADGRYYPIPLDMAAL